MKAFQLTFAFLICLIAMLLCASFDNLVLPIVGLIFYGQAPENLAPWIALWIVASLLPFIWFGLTANSIVISKESKTRIVWVPLITSVLLILSTYLSDILNFRLAALATFPLMLSVLVGLIWAYFKVLFRRSKALA